MSRIVVLGDVLLDREVEGTCQRLCPDAPAPVVDQTSSRMRPGGAGLAALLARRHVDHVTIVTTFADDERAAELRRMFADESVEVIFDVVAGRTPEKTRVSAQGRPLLRLDRGRLDNGRAPVSAAFTRSARSVLRSADAVLVSDYGHGLVAVLETLGDAMDAVPVVWDPHPKGVSPRSDATVVTPSQAEAAAASGLVRHRGLDDLRLAIEDSEALVHRWGVASVATTCGASGAVLARGDSAPLIVPCPEVHAVADTCGAGDAFAAAAAAALADGAVLSEAVERAVGVASGFVAAGGARTVRVGEYDVDADLDVDDAVGSQRAERRPEVVVAAGGCFDVVHAGHVRMLEQARLLGDRLVVLLNSDASVRRLKGPMRPVNGADDRAAVLRALACVDDVVVFDDDTPREALRRLRPHLFVKGGDYSGELVESAVMREWGGSVVTLPYLAGRSSTRILEA